MSSLYCFFIWKKCLKGYINDYRTSIFLELGLYIAKIVLLVADWHEVYRDVNITDTVSAFKKTKVILSALLWEAPASPVKFRKK